jgi:Dyp-type peroxidase family
MLDLEDIQGDVVIGLQKDIENFVFFKIVDKFAFKGLVKQHVIGRITSAHLAHQRELIIRRRQEQGLRTRERFQGLAIGFTKDGITCLIGDRRPSLDASFEKGADHPDTVKALNDPAKSAWLPGFVADRIDGVLLVTGHDRAFVRFHSNEVLSLLGASIKVVYSEIGNTRPGAERRHEHFGFRDGISQPGIRGLTLPSRPSGAPDQGLPGQDLLWPGEFILGYPGQDPRDPREPGPIASLPAPWAKNGSFMVFRRLEQRVPEFHAFVRAQAARFAIYPELLAARMVGRWRSGAPLELAPFEDKPSLAGNDRRNNDFGYAGDPWQRACPYAAHIRKTNPRGDVSTESAEMLRHRIIRQGISFGPEVQPGETTTRHSRGLMFVCYQTSIERQFEYIQSHYANSPEFVGGKSRPGGGSVTPGFDPIIGQAPGNGARQMDEPYPNYPAGSRRTTLELPSQFVVLTAAAYFFMPSITALRTALTR